MSGDKLTTVRCPEPFEPLFAEAERLVGGFFSKIERNPEQGKIEIGGMRYLLFRADSLAIELHEELRKTFGEVGARQVRYKLARACGIRDARAFHERLGVTDPTMRLALGPVHFAHVGWANVDILPESDPRPDDSYLLAYNHPSSFEADAYLSNGMRSKSPECLMNAGYSAGWCQVSYGVELRAEELLCRARGDDRCFFVMATPGRMPRVLRDYQQRLGL